MAATSRIPLPMQWRYRSTRRWPIPSTTNNTITFNYKRRVTDLTLTDYAVGTAHFVLGYPSGLPLKYADSGILSKELEKVKEELKALK